MIAYYHKYYSEYGVAAVCVDDEFMAEDTRIMGKKIVPLSKAVDIHTRGRMMIIAPLDGERIRQARESAHRKMKDIGYEFVSYISSSADICTSRKGENIAILEAYSLQPFIRIGNMVSIWSNGHVEHHPESEVNVTVTSIVVMSGNYGIERASFLGVGSSVEDRIGPAKVSLINSFGLAESVNKCEGDSKADWLSRDTIGLSMGIHVGEQRLAKTLGVREK